jgi:hypothetical protein
MDRMEHSTLCRCCIPVKVSTQPERGLLASRDAIVQDATIAKEKKGYVTRLPDPDAEQLTRAPQTRNEAHAGAQQTAASESCCCRQNNSGNAPKTLWEGRWSSLPANVLASPMSTLRQCCSAQPEHVAAGSSSQSPVITQPRVVSHSVQGWPTYPKTERFSGSQ